MSHPDPTKDYSEELVGNNLKNCPFCDAEDQEGEDMGDNPSFLCFTCSNCNREFDSGTKSYYQLTQESIDKANIIKRQEKRFNALMVVSKEFAREVASRLKGTDDIKKAWEIAGVAKSQLEMLEDERSSLHQILDLRERM